MMGSSATSMSTIFNRFVNISPPGIDILDMSSGDGVSSLPTGETLIKISFRLKIGDLIDSTIMQLLPINFAKEMVSMLINGSDDSEPVAVESAAAVEAPERPIPQQQTSTQPPQAAPVNQQYNQPNYGMPQGFDPNQQVPYPGPQHYGGMPNRNVNVQPVQFSNLETGSFGHVDQNNLNLLMDIPLKVTVELGRTQKQIKDILELSQGSIIELDKLAGEPVDILVNNKLIAKGEVVVIDENFGVRVIDILSQWDRIQKLQ
ncbi:flagellar motor switch protein FliN [Paenibacillus pini JCM 16418]|uniref:Flagellar motor switch protein FliN n=1 Tax=Paenibacillus pini JCM 16418 TaxID=1236976 RepID=W7YYI8_9BACL|nr:flagellar motor switch protein FliN [Paenibacillus pini JCM 16418]